MQRYFCLGEYWSEIWGVRIKGTLERKAWYNLLKSRNGVTNESEALLQLPHDKFSVEHFFIQYSFYTLRMCQALRWAMIKSNSLGFARLREGHARKREQIKEPDHCPLWWGLQRGETTAQGEQHLLQIGKSIEPLGSAIEAGIRMKSGQEVRPFQPKGRVSLVGNLPGQSSYRGNLPVFFLEQWDSSQYRQNAFCP